VTADEVPDPQDLDMWLEVDGTAIRTDRQRQGVRVAYLVSYVSRFMSLNREISYRPARRLASFWLKPPVYLRAW